MMETTARIKRFTAPLGSHPCLVHGTQYIERQTYDGIEQWRLVRMDIQQPWMLTYERIGIRPPFAMRPAAVSVGLGYLPA